MKNKTKHPLYNVWAGMISRCRTEPRYQGIKVCERWMDFENFIADMGERPSPEHSLDREDTLGNYEPGNCRWATDEEQALNRKNAHIVEHNGKRKNVAAWAKEYGIEPHVLFGRVNAGWDFERALTEPVRSHSAPKKMRTAVVSFRPTPENEQFLKAAQSNGSIASYWINKGLDLMREQSAA